MTATLGSTVLTVAPFAGAWIEMRVQPAFCKYASTSLPSRERGLKLRALDRKAEAAAVAPFAGAWIEIRPAYAWCGYRAVAPFAGAWIEITAA